MRDYIKSCVEAVVNFSGMEEAMPEGSDVVILTYDQLYYLIQNAKWEVE